MSRPEWHGQRYSILAYAGVPWNRLNCAGGLSNFVWRFLSASSLRMDVTPLSVCGSHPIRARSLIESDPPVRLLPFLDGERTIVSLLIGEAGPEPRHRVRGAKCGAPAQSSPAAIIQRSSAQLRQIYQRCSNSTRLLVAKQLLGCVRQRAITRS